MRRFFVCVFAAVAALAASTALAGKTQVSASSFAPAGKTGAHYGRSDGVYQDATSYGAWIIENGTAGAPLGPTYYEDFTKYGDAKGWTCLDMDGAGACAGNTALVPCLCTFGDGLKLFYIPLLQQDIAPDMDAAGLDIGCDQTDNDGVELIGGIGGASGRPFIIGDDPAFYFCATITIADVSGTDDFHIGFRRAEAATATFDNYNDLATIGCISGDIYIETIDDNAATTSTDTTDNWADAATKKLCVNVSGAGVVTYTIDGSAPTTTAAFTWDDGDPVVPFIHYLHATTSPGAIHVVKWEVGYTE